MQESRRRLRRPASVPKTTTSSSQVGIFFYLDGKLFIDATPIEQAEECVGFVNHALGHEAYWAQLQRTGQVPADQEYQDCQRGRVVFNRKDDRFILYVDECLLGRIRVLKEIIGRMGLPSGRKTKVLDDPHYRCSVCVGDNLF
jgi:hypothetical protein